MKGFIPGNSKDTGGYQFHGNLMFIYRMYKSTLLDHILPTPNSKADQNLITAFLSTFSKR